MCGNNGCKVCPNLVASTEVTVAANELQITIPAMTINNNEKICLLIAQAIPAGADTLPVVILNGTGGTVIQMINRCGDGVRCLRTHHNKGKSLHHLLYVALGM